jgi:hypothetical protein
MSTINHVTIAERLTTDRLQSYLAASGGDLPLAIELYDWNARIGGALHEDIGRIEVVFRNALDAALVAYGAANGWPAVWYDRAALFPGRHGRRALEDITAARSRAARRGVVETHGKVIAELTFGFWRFLCTAPYLTSLWVPALADTFPNHPYAGGSSHRARRGRRSDPACPFPSESNRSSRAGSPPRFATRSRQHHGTRRMDLPGHPVMDDRVE